jgi:hypothetical protein
MIAHACRQKGAGPVPGVAPHSGLTGPFGVAEPEPADQPTLEIPEDTDAKPSAGGGELGREASPRSR